MASDIVADAKAWLEWRPPHRSSQDGRTHSDDCHRVHVDCLIERLVAEVERHRMTEEERKASVDAIACCEDITYGGPSDPGAAAVLRNYLARTAPPAAS